MIGPVRIIPVLNLPLIQPDDDLAKTIVDSLTVVASPIMKGDVLVIGQKAVSKAENRLVNSSNVTLSKRANVSARSTRRNPAFDQLAIQESKKTATTRR